MHSQNYKAYIAECLGTAFFIFIILSTRNIYAITLTVFIILYSITHVSGAHINPIVTIIEILDNKLPKCEFVPMVISQVAGGLLGYEIYNMTKV